MSNLDDHPIEQELKNLSVDEIVRLWKGDILKRFSEVCVQGDKLSDFLAKVDPSRFKKAEKTESAPDKSVNLYNEVKGPNGSLLYTEALSVDLSTESAYRLNFVESPEGMQEKLRLMDEDPNLPIKFVTLPEGLRIDVITGRERVFRPRAN